MVADAFSASISEGINRFVKEHNSECIISGANNDYDRFINAIDHPGKGIDGLLIIPYELSECEESVKKAIERGLEVVFIDRRLESFDVCSVCSDHFSAGYQATKHLLQEHGQPVYHIGTITQPSSCRQWVEGWKTAMNEFNYTNPEKYLSKIEMSEAKLTASIVDYNHNYIKSAKKLFNSNKQDEYFIFTGNDYVARGVYKAADDLGLEIGKDVFVASISNLPFAERLPVPLTSVDQNLEKVGYEAAKVLYEKLTGTLPKSVHRVLPVSLIVRKSSLKINLS
jgi:LacI family transcriptional regulator